jgi:NAD(P)-dependent dehydrogenase (short-subunit alcohol dehydrogenase family)
MAGSDAVSTNASALTDAHGALAVGAESLHNCFWARGFAQLPLEPEMPPSPIRGVGWKAQKPCGSGTSRKRLMGLGPTTFCMASTTQIPAFGGLSPCSVVAVLLGARGQAARWASPSTKRSRRSSKCWSLSALATCSATWTRCGKRSLGRAAKWAVAGFSSGLAHEIAPFGVKLTVLEPGGMRTDWAGSSMTIPKPSAPYQPTIGAFAELVRRGSGDEANDARRVAQVVRDVAGRDDAPLRLLLGTDAVPMAQQAAHELAASDEAWREVSLSVAYGTPT